MRWLILVAMLGCSASDDIPAPLVAALNPNHGPPGAVIMLTGNYFCQQPLTGEDNVCDAVGTVNFGATPGIVSAYTDTSIMVEVPDGLSGQVPVSVTAAGKTSNSVTFTPD
jgi:hypothetical protein